MELQRSKPAREPMDEETIIALYWQRDEQAIAQTDFKYKAYLLSAAYRILHDSLDCEECLNDTYIDAWNSMPPSESFFSCSMSFDALGVPRIRARRSGSVACTEMYRGEAWRLTMRSISRSDRLVRVT